MSFIHKLWLDTHRIPQTGPQDRLTSTQVHPQICPQEQLTDFDFEQQKKGRRMHCPYCRHTDSKVLDSRATDDGLSVAAPGVSAHPVSGGSPPSSRCSWSW